MAVKSVILHILLAAVLVTVPNVHALEYTAYYKNLVTVSYLDDGPLRDLVGDSTLVDDYQRLRFKFEHEFFDGFEADVDYEIIAAWGESVPLYRTLRESIGLDGSALLTSIVPQPRPRFLDMEKDVLDENRFNARHQIDRLRLRSISQDTEIAIGRQPVTWGSGMLWSPMDLFAGFSPTEIDREEKPGVDVVRAILTPGRDLTLDAVYEPLDFDGAGSVDTDDSSAAVRASGKLGEYDVFVTGGYVAGDWVAGFDFSGYLGDAGFRGELLYTDVQHDEDNDHIRAVVGCDYSFHAEWQPYVMVEYHFNGLGAGSPAEYADVLTSESFMRAYRRGAVYNIARHYIGATVQLTVTPLIGIASRTIANLDDSSLNEYLSLYYSTSQNTEIIVGQNFGIGDSTDEFGVQPDQTLMYFKGYF